MDPSGIVAEKETYFFQQLSPRRTPKRRKKLPEELPHDLRFAHLNPRVAAYLANKEKDQKLGESFDDGLGSKSLLPQINQTVSLLKQSLDSILSDCDPQRLQFDASKSNAEGLLDQLSRILYLFERFKPHIPFSLESQLLWSWRELIIETKYNPRKWQLPASKENYEKALKSELSSKTTEERESAEGDEEMKSKDLDGRRSTRMRLSSRTSTMPGLPEEGDGNKSRDSQLRMAGPPKPRTRLEKYRAGSVESKDARPGSRQSMMRKSVGRPDDLLSMLAESMSDAKSIAQPSFVQTIQFQLSSKLCDDRGWIVHPDPKNDQERQTMLEWATQRLQLSIKHKREQAALEAELGMDTPTQLRYYGDTHREQLTKYKGHRTKVNPALMKGQKPRIPPLQATRTDGRPLLMTTVADGSSTVFYTSGRPAIVTSRSCTSKPGFYTIVYDNTPDQPILATFTPSGRGCCHHGNGNIHFLSTEKGGTLADQQGAVTKRWRWPSGTAKMPVTVVCQLSAALTFRCSNQHQMTVHYSAHKEQVKINVGVTPGSEEAPSREDMGHLVSGMDFSSQAAKDFSKPFKAKQVQMQTKPKKSKKLLLMLSATRPMSGLLGAFTSSLGSPCTPGDGDSKPSTPATPDMGLEKPRSPVPASEIQKLLVDFPGADKSENDVEADKDLARIQRKIKMVSEDWLEHYRLAVGMSSPHLRTLRDRPPRAHAHRQTKSAKSGHGAGGRVVIESQATAVPKVTVSLRAPSAPPGRTLPRPVSALSTSPSEPAPTGVKFDARPPEEIMVDPETEGDGQAGDTADEEIVNRPLRRLSSARAPGSPHRDRSPSHRTKSAPPSRTGTSLDLSTPPGSALCPVALRSGLLGEHSDGGPPAVCRCSRHHIPVVTDIEYEELVLRRAPPGQLVIVSIISTLLPAVSPGEEMLSSLHAAQNKNRSRPCTQSRTDAYRILLYDVHTAAQLSDHSQPLLTRRHNVTPGMFLMYEGGKLLFCDHIFNGYGNARKDLHKQMRKTRHLAAMGESLPTDFRFSPQRGRHGSRSAWGGMDGMTRGHGGMSRGMDGKHTSDVSLSSGDSVDLMPYTQHTSGVDTSTRFVRASLGALGYDVRPSATPRATPLSKKTSYSTVSTSLSIPQIQVTPSSSQVRNTASNRSIKVR